MKSLFGSVSTFLLLFVCCRVASPAYGADSGLESALKAKDTAELERIVAADRSVATRASSSGNTALHYAAALNRADAIRILVEAGADVGACRLDGHTPLHVAAAMNGPEAVIELLRLGASPLAQGNDGATPLVMAARKRAYGAGAALLQMSQVAYMDMSLDFRTPTGRQCIESGDMEHLDAFLGRLLRTQPNENVKFAYGMVKFSRKDYPRAELMFEDIVKNLNPGNARARMELAQTYVALERYDEARQELRGMLRHELPQDTRQIIQQNLEQLEDEKVGKRGFLSGRIDAGVIDDSNVNIGPDSPTINIAPIILGTESITELVVDEMSRPQDAQGTFYLATLSGLYDVGDWGLWALTLDGAFYGNSFSDHSDEETGYYQGMFGFRRAEGRHNVQIPVSYSHIDRGSDPLADIVGISPSWSRLSASAMHMTTLGLESRVYDELEDRDSLYATLVESYQKELTPSQRLQISGALLYESAEAEIYSYDGFSLIIRDDVAVYSSIVIYGAARYTYSGYKERETLATETRVDQQLQLVAGINWAFRESLGVDFSFVTTDNQSTFDLYQYDRDVLTLSAFYSF